MVRAKKKWGQHWLASRSLAVSLARTLEVRADDVVVEIGPGTGLFTRALLDLGAEVIAIEVDPERAAQIELEFADRRLTVIRADVLQAPVPWPDRPVRLTGNLPYNLSGPILRWTANHRARLTDAHFMLQEEVVDRITAAEGNRTYGALSVQMQWQFDVETVKRLAPGAFRPPPKVRSAFLRLRPNAAPPPTAAAARLVRDGFAQRRKTLRRALVAAGWENEPVAAAIAAIGARPDVRAEALAPAAWAELARRLERPA
jgi:16S rRNA (adenine1518-N6/adenine1519-N6)-dimethyltransferase